MILVPLSTWKSQIVIYITTPSYFIHSNTVHLKIVHCHQEQVLFFSAFTVLFQGKPASCYSDISVQNL